MFNSFAAGLGYILNKSRFSISEKIPTGSISITSVCVSLPQLFSAVSVTVYVPGVL